MKGYILFQAFEGVSVIFETFIVYQYISGLFVQTKESKKGFLCYSVFCFGLSILSLCIPIPAVLILYTLFGIYLLELLLCDSTIVTRLFSILYFAAIMIISEMFCSALISGLWNIELSNTLTYGIPRVLSIVIAKLIQVLAVKMTIFAANWKKDEIDRIEFQFILPMLMCQVLSILLAYHIFILCFYSYEEFDFLGFMSVFGIMYINVIIFWYFDKIKMAYRYKAKSEAMAIKLELQEEYYCTLETHQKETISLWHDIKKHIDLIKELAFIEQDGVASNYLDELQNDMRKRLSIVKTDDPIVGALLTEQIKRADREGVALELDLRIGVQTKIQPIDLCVILGNLFENAFEACALLQDDNKKHIKAEIKQREQLLFIRISNAYNPKTKKEKRSSRHGYGIDNIKRSVRKYAGKFDIDVSETEFSTTIIIP